VEFLPGYFHSPGKIKRNCYFYLKNMAFNAALDDKCLPELLEAAREFVQTLAPK
jgi:hypothetical protein